MRRRIISYIVGITILILLYISSQLNYLLFHSIAEILVTSIAFTIFLLTWNSMKYMRNNYFIAVGITYLFLGILNIFHILSYKGMNIFPDYDYYANQLWIAARYFESTTMLIAILLFLKKDHINADWIMFVYGVITVGLLYSIFIWKVFPVCFIEGQGQTTFKIFSEYIVSMIFAVNLLLLYKFRHRFNKKSYQLVTFAVIAMITADLLFTLYTDNYSLLNMTGHYFVLLSFFLIYKVVIEQGVKEPYELIFLELKKSEQSLQEKNNLLESRINQDGLTGLYNHRYLYERLDQEISRSIRHNHSLAIVLFDLDEFKLVNDQFGHQTGDKVLVQVAENLKKNIRIGDAVGRYGGEEFLLILPETEKTEAYQIAQRICKDLDESTIIEGLHITISGGVALLDQLKNVDNTSSHLIKLADQKLYLAKSNGRNRIE